MTLEIVCEAVYVGWGAEGGVCCHMDALLLAEFDGPVIPPVRVDLHLCPNSCSVAKPLVESLLHLNDVKRWAQGIKQE